MSEIINCCRVCLQIKSSCVSLYQHVQQNYLPSVIENICGIVISSLDEPQALVCKECAEAIINADSIIRKCQESDRRLFEQRNISEDSDRQCKLVEAENWPESAECQHEAEPHDQNYFLEPEILVEPILGNYLQEDDKSDLVVATHSGGKKTRKQKSRLKSKDHGEYQECERFEDNPAALLYQSQFRTTKPKKTFVRSREQYLKRKIRNYPVREPLKLIGGAGVVRKRKPKSYHRAIPNFYFHCELCHEFESNVASYAVTHLSTVHAIERPAIFRCPHCDIKPFIKNQSLQEHIATIHEQQPKKRNFACQECGKTFIKNCHLQKHLISVHKMGEKCFKGKVAKCDKEYADSHALLADNENTESLLSLHRCDACGKYYMDLKSLSDHLKAVHIDEGFNCLQCGYRFREKVRYEAHVKRAKCKPPCFLCRYCERTFFKLVQLEEHQEKMH